MRIKILVSCSGLDFAYMQGDEVTVPDELGNDLTIGGLAEKISESELNSKVKEKQKPKAGAKANADA